MKIQKTIPLYSEVLIGYIWHLVTEKKIGGVLTNHNEFFPYGYKVKKIKKWKNNF